MEITEKKEAESKGLNPQSVTEATSFNSDKEAEDRERQARDLKAGLHPLKHKFVFWYTRRTPGVRTQTSYEDNIKKIVDFSTVEGFWICYCHLARPSALPSPTDLHLFKEGIRPLWEDSANCNGGKWIIRFKKVVSGRFWEDLDYPISDHYLILLDGPSNISFMEEGGWKPNINGMTSETLGSDDVRMLGVLFSKEVFVALSSCCGDKALQSDGFVAVL
ncbi:Eukaryotic translation initiation factor NCBP [Vitis vinifera]|uniref:mRNA cap-binding protein n=1 Tax=Vitis vinifera TaxID=29760 RepID=A0A438JL42_VITVI|nr:Eukaryotic translation initiation factor NCBP [Vitis vinifera]